MLNQQVWVRRCQGVGGLALMLAAVPLGALVHPEGALKVPNPHFVPGSTVRVGGEQFAGGGKLELVLVGVAGRFRLGEVTTDSVGGFAESFEVPMDVEVGSYRLVAIATDGDEVATFNVDMLAAPAEPQKDGDSRSEDQEASAEELALDRAPRPWVKGGAIVGIVLALALGGVLLRKPQG